MLRRRESAISRKHNRRQPECSITPYPVYKSRAAAMHVVSKLCFFPKGTRFYSMQLALGLVSLGYVPLSPRKEQSGFTSMELMLWLRLILPHRGAWTLSVFENVLGCSTRAEGLSFGKVHRNRLSYTTTKEQAWTALCCRSLRNH